MGNILVVDDDPAIQTTLKQVLEREGWSVQIAGDATSAIRKIGLSLFDLVICDVRIPGMNGLELLKKIKSTNPELDVMIITAYATVENGVTAIKDGAYDYLMKPLDISELSHKVSKVMEKKILEKKVSYLQEELKDRYRFSSIVGNTPDMVKIYEMIDKLRNADCNILIEGESGTGKELIARAIHFNGALSRRPFIAVSCGALPESIIERELFGHEKGAFTDASSRMQGYFEACNGGTLFLDEITDLTLNIQAKLLRVIEEKQFFRLGSTKPIRVEVRLLSAANKDVHSSIKNGTFREDLYYRLSVVSIRVPPLRERRDDIPLLLKHFLKKYSQKYGKKITCIAKDAEALLLSYHWPGNVRQLEHIIERAVALTEEKSITGSDLPEEVSLFQPSSDLTTTYQNGLSYPEAKSKINKAFDMNFISYHLKKAGGNVARAAGEMQIQRTSLQRLMKKHDIKGKQFKNVQ